MVDQDYVEKLDAETRKWLAEFNDHHHGASFSPTDAQAWSTDERRAAYRAKNASGRDAYTIHEVSGRVSHIPDLERKTPSGRPRSFDPVAAPELDLAPTPGYLDAAEYKAALAEYRAAMPDRGFSKDAPLTPKFRRARARLERLVKKYGPFPEDK